MAAMHATAAPLSAKLQLSSEQSDRLKDITDDLSKDLEAIRPDLVEKQEALQAAIYDQDTEKAEALIEEINDLHARLSRATLTARLHTVAMLDKEQVKLLAEVETQAPTCGVSAAARTTLTDSAGWSTLGALLTETVVKPEQASATPVPVSMPVPLSGGGCGGGCGGGEAGNGGHAAPAHATVQASAR
jgi:chromosome segregation ATPase